MGIESQRVGKHMFSITPAEKCNAGFADLGRIPRIARIEFRRSVEFSKRALPFTAAAMNRSADIPTIGATRLEFDGPVEFSQPSIVVTIAPVIKQREREVCIRQSRSNCYCTVDVRL